MVPLNELLMVVVYLIIVGLIFWVILWAIGAIGIPEPFNKVARVLVILVGLLVVVSILLNMLGHPLLR